MDSSQRIRLRIVEKTSGRSAIRKSLTFAGTSTERYSPFYICGCSGFLLALAVEIGLAIRLSLPLWVGVIIVPAAVFVGTVSKSDSDGTVILPIFGICA